jgi:glycosyltransferase involved in cell wall biosynthesis
MAPRTLHIITSKKPGGAEYFFTRLVNAMNVAGQPTEAAVSTGCLFTDKLDTTLKIHRLPMKGAWDLYSKWRINSLIKQQQIDIVQTYLGRAARLARSASGAAQLVCRVGGFYPQQQYAHADYLICNSHGLCEHIAKGGFPVNRIYRIPNFANQTELMLTEKKQQLREMYGIAVDDLLICSVGRLHSIKGIDTLLHAFAKLRKRYQQRRCKLMLVGAGPQEESLRQLSESLHIQQDVAWTGWQQTPDPFYQAADIFVCASRQEGFGNVILEAWANRVAVISTATEGPSELIEHGHTGVITPIDNSDAMADKLYQLANDDALRSELVAQAAKQLTSHYSEAAVAKQYANFYRDISR